MNSNADPVVEEEIECKILPSTVPGPHDSGCSCCHSNEFKPKISDNNEEQQCQVKSTYYSKLTNRYFRDIFDLPSRVETKDFYSQRDESLKSGRQFVDDSFPPSNDSITFDGVTNRQYEWKRPIEIVSDPRFFVEGATRFDIQQGELGDCWLLAAVSTLTLNPRQFHVVVPVDQGFHYKYAGIFHFRFWQNGKWEDIFIDDLLPTYRGQLVFMHSKTQNEFWCALLEKAYAKMYGCYESLKGGHMNESMVDMTGGVVETIQLRQLPKNLFGKMKAAYDRGAMMGSGIEPDNMYSPPEGRLKNGLITRHAYSVTKVTSVSVHQRDEQLVRLHNPWGNEAEWRGAWSDESQEWRSVKGSERADLGLTFDDDGEFWMPFNEFTRNFTTLDICDLTPDVFTDIVDPNNGEDQQQEEVVKRQWKMKMHHGEWVPGLSAGGCRNFLDSFPQNPQKVVLLDKSTDGGEHCTLVVSLMQVNVRQRKRFGIDYVPIGFSIYKLPPGYVPGKPLNIDFFKYNSSCGRAPYFLNTREVAHHFQLPAGVYIVVPSTFQPNCNAQFLLRIFTESHTKTNRLR